MKTNFRRGFTLIELLVVIAIIGILAGTLIYSYSGVRGRARDAKRISELDQVRQALQLYSQDNATYPTADTCTPLSDPTMVSIFQPTGKPAYLPQIPSDPSYTGTGSSWPDYCYISPSSEGGSHFVLWAKLETATNANAYKAGSHVPTDSSTPPTGYGPDSYFTEGSL